MCEQRALGCLLSLCVAETTLRVVQSGRGACLLCMTRDGQPMPTTSNNHARTQGRTPPKTAHRSAPHHVTLTRSRKHLTRSRRKMNAPTNPGAQSRRRGESVRRNMPTYLLKRTRAATQTSTSASADECVRRMTCEGRQGQRMSVGEDMKLLPVSSAMNAPRSTFLRNRTRKRTFLEAAPHLRNHKSSNEDPSLTARVHRENRSRPSNAKASPPSLFAEEVVDQWQRRGILDESPHPVRRTSKL